MLQFKLFLWYLFDVYYFIYKDKWSSLIETLLLGYSANPDSWTECKELIIFFRSAISALDEGLWSL